MAVGVLVVVLFYLLERTLIMDQIIASLQASAARISADFAASKQAVASLTAQVTDLQAQLAAAQANAVSDAQRAQLQAVVAQLDAADPAPTV